MSFLISIIRFINSFIRPSASQNRKALRKRGEKVESFIIREARYEELENLASLHVHTWNETYPLITSKPTYEIRAFQWRENFSKRKNDWFCFVVENETAKLIGFATGNRYVDPLPAGFNGQLNKIYLLKQYQRLGLGKRLLGFIARRFRSMEIDSIILFSESANPSGKFYEKLGAERLFDEKGKFHGGYGWKDLGPLTILAE